LVVGFILVLAGNAQALNCGEWRRDLSEDHRLLYLSGFMHGVSITAMVYKVLAEDIWEKTTTVETMMLNVNVLCGNPSRKSDDIWEIIREISRRVK